MNYNIKYNQIQKVICHVSAPVRRVFPIQTVPFINIEPSGFDWLKDSVSENDASKGIWMLADHFFVGNCLIFQGIHFYHQSTQ